MATRLVDDDGKTYAYLDSGRLVLTDAAADHFDRTGKLDLSGNQELRELPEDLRVEQLFLRGCTGLTGLPERLDVRFLSLADCTGVTALPRGLTCGTLIVRGTRVRSLPDDLSVIYRLDLSDCRELTHLPAGLKIGWKDLPPATVNSGSLVLRNCTSLELLPDDLDVCHLDIRGCTRLTGWPEGATARLERLFARGCSRLTTLPEDLCISRLEISDCVNLRTLPEGIRVTSEIELANTGLTDLPVSLRKARLLWRRVPVNYEIAFRPETITVGQVLGESNSALRHVLLERFGLERFVSEANAQVLDVDHDTGGERKLLRVPIEADEDLVCVVVHCPSTGQRYILRVPPTMQTCRAAIAWTAGFDNPDWYKPVLET
jgi:hypothetical protein